MSKKKIVLLGRTGWYRLAAWLFEKLVGLLVGFWVGWLDVGLVGWLVGWYVGIIGWYVGLIGCYSG